MEANMRAFHRVGRIAGITALAASALLASPGVEAVRAEPPAAASGSKPAEQCGEPVRGTASQSDVDAFVAKLRREHGAQLAADAEANGIIVLNGRGYNYGTPNDPGAIALPPEIRR
jgi:hypothetical protein